MIRLACYQGADVGQAPRDETAGRSRGLADVPIAMVKVQGGGVNGNADTAQPVLRSTRPGMVGSG